MTHKGHSHSLDCAGVGADKAIRGDSQDQGNS